MSTTMLRTAFTTCAVKGARTKASMRNGAKCASSSGSSGVSSSSMRLLSSASDGRGRRAQARAAGEKVDAAPVVALPTSDESENLLKIRHTSAHVMAMAVQKVFPSAQCTIGPWIERGFYYDFYYPEGFTNQDMKNIQKEMYKIIRKDYPLRREEVSREEAERRIRAINEPYKLEILDSIKTEPITIYHIGDEWWDLCAGPHVESTGKLDQKAFELESVAGAYWRGDETKPMLQRIYGTAWETPEQLQAYNDFKAEAARRDHRKIGKDLNLFSLQQDNAGGGLVFWHPKGAHMRHMIETYWKDLHLARGYELLYSPHVAKQELWQTSGHSDFYSENMYQPIKVEDEMYQLKPMNCPFHIVVYQDGYYSYRDLPIRWAELGTVYRYERSGTMHGLFRVRGFTQDDAHIFCLPDQITDEIKGVLDLTEEILSTFGFTNFEVNLSTRPEKSVGDDEIWIKAESALKDALDRKKWNYIVDDGGGAFYGPKIDIKILDAIGRKWQCSTVQLDFNLPERFKLNYVDKENEKQRPIMIHRAIFGSLERFFGILTENYAGEFPLWLAPTQVRLLPVTDTVSDFTESVAKKLRDAGVRVEICTGERLNKLVRNAEKAKIPIMAVVGKDEAENNTLAVRTYKDGDIGSLSVDDVLARIVTANATKGADF
jgi:threonyl-tRNA synthetase